MKTASSGSLVALSFWATVAAAAPKLHPHGVLYPRNGTTVAPGSVDFGACNDPGIVFRPGFDGRKEGSFEPRNTTQFTHGSALNIGVITGFICDRFKDTCKASTDAQTACTAAQAATTGLTGQSAADAWNNALGLSSNNTTTASADSAASVSSSASSAASLPAEKATPSINSCSYPAGAAGAAQGGVQKGVSQGGTANGSTSSNTGTGGSPYGTANSRTSGSGSTGSNAAGGSGGSSSTTGTDGTSDGLTNSGTSNGGTEGDPSSTAVTSTDTDGSNASTGTGGRSGARKGGKDGGDNVSASGTSSAQARTTASTTGGKTGAKGTEKGTSKSGGKKGGSGSGSTAPFSNSTTAVTNTTVAAGNSSALTLLASNVQTASQSEGQANAEKGQSPSATDPANFINFCTGKTLTNGLQVKGGSCNGIVMGDLPAQTDMVSQIVTFPLPGKQSNLAANTTFNITVQVQGLVPGSFTNPEVTYYAAPQELEGGKVVGHTHVTVQTLGKSLKPTTPPDASTFVFFKGINNAGDVSGGLSATVAGGLPAGNYRVCTLGSSSNHQPVLMPVAQRGAQDDCQKFVVS